VGERVRPRAIASLSGPTDSPTLTCDDADFRAQFEQVLLKARRPVAGRFRERAKVASRG
jgi:hypothetical protein